MLRRYWRSIPLALVLTGALSNAAVAALDAQYLAGSWEINMQGTCGGKNAEHLIIRANSTFEYGRRGKAEAVGFWRIENEVLAFDMLSSPADFQDIHAELKGLGQYEIDRMNLLPIDMQRDEFSAGASIGDQMQRITLHRCQ